MIEYRFDLDSNDFEPEIILKALRDEISSKKSGYFKLPYDDNILKTVKNLREKEPFSSAKNIIVIGVGGSSLGAKAIDHSLRSFIKLERKKELKELTFLENPDPLELLQKVEHIDKSETIFILISKSGNTVETMSLFRVLIKFFNIDSRYLNRNFITISDKESPLDNFAKKYNIFRFHIPKSVGGRFSVLSSVGIVPLVLAGYDMDSTILGARRFLDRFWDKKENHLLRKAHFISSNINKITSNAIFAYSSFFDDFNKWYIQLWGESLGKINKSGKRVGLTPLGLIGSIDQHSFLQLIMDGPRDKSVTFIKIKNHPTDFMIPHIFEEELESSSFIDGRTLGELLNLECDATLESLKSVGVPSDMIVLDSLNGENIGELIIYFELLTSAVGVLLEVETYNQPGVELGKTILKKRAKKL
jgi:glucose-6-phosphate isomerase